MNSCASFMATTAILFAFLILLIKGFEAEFVDYRPFMSKARGCCPLFGESGVNSVVAFTAKIYEC